MDLGSTENHNPGNNSAPEVMEYCVTKVRNSFDKIIIRVAFPGLPFVHWSSWSGARFTNMD